MKCTGQISEQDFVAVQWLHLRLRPVFRVLGLLLLVLWFSALISKFLQGLESPVERVFGFATVYCVLMFGFFIPRKWKKTYREYKLIKEPFEWGFAEDKILSKTERGEAFLEWDVFIKWREGKKFILLYQASNMMNIIPKDGFESEEDLNGAMKLFREKIGKAV